MTANLAETAVVVAVEVSTAMTGPIWVSPTKRRRALIQASFNPSKQSFATGMAAPSLTSGPRSIAPRATEPLQRLGPSG